MLSNLIFASLAIAFIGGIMGLLLAPRMKNAETVEQRIFTVIIYLVFALTVLGSSAGIHALLYLLPTL